MSPDPMPEVGQHVLVAGVIRQVEPEDDECPAQVWVDFRETGECSWVIQEDVTAEPLIRADERKKVLDVFMALRDEYAKCAGSVSVRTVVADIYQAIETIVKDPS